MIYLVSKRRIYSNKAGGKRGYYISVPSEYSQNKEYKFFLFARIDTKGEEMYDWFGQGWGTVTGLEALMNNTIFAYLDQKYIWDGDKG